MYGEAISAGLSAGTQAAGMIGDAFKQADAEEWRKLALEAARQMPLLNLGDTPDYQQLQYLGDFNPAMYQTPEAAQYQTIEDSPETRAIQMQALQRLIGQADGTFDAQNKAEQFQALDSANRMAQSREGAIRNQMERKGQGGTGVNALMQAQGAQMGANRARAGTLDAVSKAALQKLAAMQGAVGAAGQVRGQDFQRNSANANIINDFNMFNTRARNDVNQRNVDVQNQAGLRNLNTRQDIGGRNTGIHNSNIDRKTSNRVLENNSRVGRQNSIIGTMGGVASQSSNSGNVYNQLGQQGGQMFTNIGAGISAANNANPSQGYMYQNGEEGFQRSDDGSFTSQWW
jgi:hypothetical protein